MHSLSQLQLQLANLRASVSAGQKDLLADWRGCLAGSGYARDAANLAAYIAFRREDLRDLQERLSELGLSSLGRCEGHVSATLDAVSPRPWMHFPATARPATRCRARAAAIARATTA